MVDGCLSATTALPQKLALVEKRRLEGELSKIRATMARSEELLQQKERLLGPNMCAHRVAGIAGLAW